MLMPLAIINHFKPTRVLPGEKQLHELYPIGTEQSDLRLPRSERFWTWRNFFLRLDDVLKFLQSTSDSPAAPARLGRSRAVDARTDWRGERRPRGGVSGDAELFDRVTRPRLLKNKSGLRQGGERISPDSSLTIPRISVYNRVCRRSGTLQSISSRWRNPAFPRSIPRCKRPPIGWSIKRCASAVIGR